MSPENALASDAMLADLSGVDASMSRHRQAAYRLDRRQHHTRL
jgi:hypothetical protein